MCYAVLKVDKHIIWSVVFLDPFSVNVLNACGLWQSILSTLDWYSDQNYLLNTFLSLGM